MPRRIERRLSPRASSAFPRGAVAAALTLCSGIALQKAGALDFPDRDFPVTVSEIILLERLNSSIRYDPEPVVEATWKASYDRVTVVEIPSQKSRYGLFEDDANGRVDIALRGTTNLKNAMSDIEFLKKRSGRLGIYLHSGFEKSAEAIYADLLPRLKPGYSIRITGHSLGAAEAVILGMLLDRDGRRIEKILASAPPKVTDAEGWSRFQDLPVIRVVCPFDPVPFLPPRSLMYGRNPYIQGGRLILLLDGTEAAIVDSAFFDDLPDALRKARTEGQRFRVADHLLPAYLARLLPKASGIAFVDGANWQKYATPAKDEQ
jgi:hypothetical protein